MKTKNLQELTDKFNKGWKDNMALKIIKRDSNIIGIRVKNRYLDSETSTYKTFDFEFRDSYLTLPFTLKTLGRVYGVGQQKSIFPYEFVGSDTDLNYVGSVPLLKYFSDVTPKIYNSYASKFINNNWSLKDETIKYCLQDCRVLYEVINNFNYEINGMFNVTLEYFPTISSLAFGIFRTNKLVPNTVPKLVGKIHNFIKKSYTGGAVDVYNVRPIPKGTIIHEYDVVSLYPTVMHFSDMPVGTPIYFELKDPNFNVDTIKNKGKAFGFFNVEITTPDYLDQPILQTRVLTKEGYKTIAPLGTWSDMLFSVEMDNAMKYGYKFDILKGFTFSKGIIFKKFIESLFEMRLQYPKTNPMNMTSKLIMNCLYGRMAMNDAFNDTAIFTPEEYHKFESKHSDVIEEIIEVGNYIVVQYRKLSQEFLTSINEGFNNGNVNIGVGSAISASARVFMSQFKNNPNINLYYTDTDSIFTDRPLDPSFVSNNELGKFKLEYIAKKAIFLCPKVYCLELEDGRIISKIKGVTNNNLNMEDFESLLKLNNKLELNQTRWHKSLLDGNITIKDQLYNLKVTDNKRKLIYDSKNQLIDTKPFVIDMSKTIINK